MFNKEESSKKKKVEINSKISLIRIGSFFVSLTLMMSITNNSVKADDLLSHFQHEQVKMEYLSRLNDYILERQYDQDIVNLYRNGKIMINNKILPLNSFYICYNTDSVNYDFHLMSTKDDCKDIILGSREKYYFNDLVRFMDTTAFINYIKDNRTSIDKKNNIIVVNNNDLLLSYIQNWNGMIHNQVADTDAILEKVIINRGIKNEK